MAELLPVPPKPILLKQTVKRKGLFQCSCGKKYETQICHVNSGKSKSCGCYRKKVNTTHGHSRTATGPTPTYSSWHAMLQRCTNPNSKFYQYYGGRGIKVCKRWNKFENFLEDMGNCPLDKTIERKDNTKGYYKNNCRWATRKEQQYNRRDNVIVKYKGKDQLLLDVYAISGSVVKYGTVKARVVSSNWPLELALTKPVKVRGSQYG